MDLLAKAVSNVCVDGFRDGLIEPVALLSQKHGGRCPPWLSRRLLDGVERAVAAVWNRRRRVSMKHVQRASTSPCCSDSELLASRPHVINEAVALPTGLFGLETSSPPNSWSKGAMSAGVEL